jgi:hypothetical protein
MVTTYLTFTQSVIAAARPSSMSQRNAVDISNTQHSNQRTQARHASQHARLYASLTSKLCHLCIITHKKVSIHGIG